MARCEECLHFEVCEALEQGNGLMKVSPIHCGYYKPTADVVPKSEVDEIVRQWKEEANCWQNNYIAELCDNEQIKQEVAREIFEEIDKIIDNHYNRHIFGVEELFDVEKEAVMNFSGDVTYDIAELKKKYTGE